MTLAQARFKGHLEGGEVGPEDAVVYVTYRWEGGGIGHPVKGCHTLASAGSYVNQSQT